MSGYTASQATGCSLYPPKKQLDRFEQTWNASEEEESVGWEQRWGQREDVGEIEKEDDKMKKWKGSGEEREK